MALAGADAALTALTVAAGLSLGIERTLEMLKHFMDYGNGDLNDEERSASLRNAEETIRKAEAALDGKAGGASTSPSASAAGAQQAAMASRSTLTSEPSEKHLPPPIRVVEMEPLSTQDTGNAVFFQFAAAGLGIAAAWMFDLQLLTLLAQPEDAHAFLPVLDRIFTGIVIGGGSQPIHVLIRFLTERKVAEVPPGEEEKEADKTKSLAKLITSRGLVAEVKEEQALEWVDIAYTGGVLPKELETVHKRSGPPNMIIYHHTAMSSASPFEDVVKEFRETKKWATGYHCVIMPDGAIKPFCRWDRYGSHAMGMNDRSLGLAFHGNFHTELGDKYSNADGRFGNQKPTQAQLHAGARVIALWLRLYPTILGKDLAPSFERSVLPHRKAMVDPQHTVCPGSNFPIDDFQGLVVQYHNAWKRSEVAEAGVNAFRQLAYV